MVAAHYKAKKCNITMADTRLVVNFIILCKTNFQAIFQTYFGPPPLVGSTTLITITDAVMLKVPSDLV